MIRSLASTSEGRSGVPKCIFLPQPSKAVRRSSIVPKAYVLKDDFTIFRATLQESIDFVVSECDLAASLLPPTYASGGGDIGRATKGAALALKSRMLLYAASELYNNPSWAAGYSKPELISVTGDRTAKWQAAKAAAKAVIDLGIYSLQKHRKSWLRISCAFANYKFPDR